ncbi:MAG: TonB-dependent receptor [Gammaproteobacteria bacterium]
MYAATPRVAAAIASAIAAACLPPTAQAAKSNPETGRGLEEIVVTANPLGNEAPHIAQPVIVLGGEELLRKQASTLGETLGRELGMSSTSFGHGASRPLIRGLGGSRVRILESGIGSMDVSNLSDDHAVSVDPSAASQVEVLKGPATLLYGSGAIGGVVNVVTRRIPTDVPARPALDAQYRFDSALGGHSGGGSIDAGSGRFAAHVEGLARSTSDYDIPGFGALAPAPGERGGRLENSDTRVEQLAGGGSFVGERGHLGFSIGHYASNYGVPGRDSRIDLDQDRYDIAGELRAPLPGLEVLRMKLGHNDYTHAELEPDGTVGTLFLNDEYEGRVELGHESLGGFRGVAGVQVQHRNFQAVGEEQLTPAVQGRSVGLFLVEERDFDVLHLEFGARYENVDYEPEPGRPGRAFDVYSLSAGGIWTLADAATAGVSITRSQRAPGIEELYNDGPHDATASFEQGDPDLGVETANNLDFTLRGGGGAWSWRVNLFASYYENFIHGANVDADGDGAADFVDEEGDPADPADGVLLIRYAQHDAVFYGAEAETTFGVLRSDVHGELDLRLFADGVRGRLTDGDDLPRITPIRFGAGLDYRRGPLNADFEVRSVRRQDDTAPLETPTAGYTWVEAGMAWTFDAEGTWTLSLRGTNLLDAEIRQHTSFLKTVAPQPGRSLQAGLRVRF